MTDPADRFPHAKPQPQTASGARSGPTHNRLYTGNAGGIANRTALGGEVTPSGTQSPPSPLPLPPRQVSLAPGDLEPHWKGDFICNGRPFPLVLSATWSGYAADLVPVYCHRLECPYCSTPVAHMERMFSDRGWRDPAGGLAHATSHLRDHGCVQRLDYQLSPEAASRIRRDLQAARRSHVPQAGVVIATRDGRVSFLVTPQSAAFVRRRLGGPEYEGALTPATVSAIMARGYRWLRGFGEIDTFVDGWRKPKTPEQEERERTVPLDRRECAPHMSELACLREEDVVLRSGAIPRKLHMTPEELRDLLDESDRQGVREEILLAIADVLDNHISLHEFSLMTSPIRPAGAAIT